MSGNFLIITSQGSSAGIPIKVLTGVGTGTGYLPIPIGFNRSECKFLISFQATGGGDNHYGVVSEDGYVSFLLHTQAYRYIVIGIKE